MKKPRKIPRKPKTTIKVPAKPTYTVTDAGKAAGLAANAAEAIKLAISGEQEIKANAAAKPKKENEGRLWVQDDDDSIRPILVAVGITDILLIVAGDDPVAIGEQLAGVVGAELEQPAIANNATSASATGGSWSSRTPRSHCGRSVAAKVSSTSRLTTRR